MSSNRDYDTEIEVANSLFLTSTLGKEKGKKQKNFTIFPIC